MDRPQLLSYCTFSKNQTPDNVHRIYHDTEYGFPLSTDDDLFARLVLEINQAGLSWDTILKKKAQFFKAYSNFNIKKVASYKEKDIDRLMLDAGIIRNRLKINAAIHNAQVIISLQQDHGSFAAWLDLHHPLTKEQWVKLFKKTFKFTGGEITNEFLMSTGYLYGTHNENCPVYHKIAKKKPKWMENG